MGYDRVTFGPITASVSRHNSQRDEEDDALWEDLCARIQALCDEDKYRHLGVMT